MTRNQAGQCLDAAQWESYCETKVALRYTWTMLIVYEFEVYVF